MSQQDDDVKADEDAEERRLKRIAMSHVAQLAEHFDTVQVICTKHGPEGTGAVFWGEGNWYARRESVREFLKQR